MNRWKLPAAMMALVGCLGLIASPALALLVRPVVIELASTGGGSSASLEVVNDRNVPMTIEVKVQDLKVPEKGDPVITPSSGDDFLIFPTIARVAPGARQVFRIRYIGNPTPDEGRLFMFSTSELPISRDASDSRAQVQVLYSINSVVAVRPPKSTADIKIARVSPAINEKGEKGLEVLFENDGAAHGFVGAATLSLSSGSWKKSLDANEMSKAFGLGLIPARSKRAMFLVLPDAPTTGQFATSIKPAAV